MLDRLCNKCLNNNNGWCKALKTNKGLRDLTECIHFNSIEPDNIKSISEQQIKEYDIYKILDSMQKQLDEIQQIVTIIKNEMI